MEPDHNVNLYQMRIKELLGEIERLRALLASVAQWDAAPSESYGDRESVMFEVRTAVAEFNK